MSAIVNTFIIYKFLKLLVTPFNETDAFKLGIIDKNGKYLKKERELVGSKEKLASNIFTRLVWNIKKLLVKVPGGSSVVGSLATAFVLLKEEVEKVGGDGDEFQRAFEEYLAEEYDLDIHTELLNEQSKSINT